MKMARGTRMGTLVSVPQCGLLRLLGYLQTAARARALVDHWVDARRLVEVALM